ncbi:hypothetical protein GN244_ATG05869 [Phytophthora infestans]|uniref:Uncharacterized protein n=1 Tax=Phytophthora infestans TaxID=4787 RepID=A0A833SY92_PHYIN|nr:hypothetical protein GN244_ATG05869 [Phytophthora infestans]
MFALVLQAREGPRSFGSRKSLTSKFAVDPLILAMGPKYRRLTFTYWALVLAAALLNYVCVASQVTESSFPTTAPLDLDVTLTGMRVTRRLRSTTVNGSEDYEDRAFPGATKRKDLTQAETKKLQQIAGGAQTKLTSYKLKNWMDDGNLQTTFTNS